MLRVKNLTEGSISRHLYHLALPIMGTSFVQMAYSFTDMAWLGRLGSESVAAVGIISVFLWIAQSLTYLTKTGSEVTIGQAIGRGAPEEAQTFASHNTTLSIVTSLIWSLIYYIFATPLISLYQPSDVVSEFAHSYMYIAILGIPATFLTSTLFGIYNATGNSRIPFAILSIGLVCNMILDPLLINYYNFGVSGAAWATVISQWLVYIIFYIRLRRFDKLLSNFSLVSRLKLSYVWEITRIGLPASALNMLFAFITIYMGRLASNVGGHIGIAVLTTGGQLEALTWNTAQGATTALSTIVAQNYAAKRYDRVWQAYKTTLAFTLSIGLAGMLYFILGGEDLFRLIVPDNDTAIAGGIYMAISGYSQILMMLEITTQGLLYGMGRSYLPAGISILGNILRIPIALWLISLGVGLSSIWWAVSISAGIKGLFALIVIYLVYRKLSKSSIR